MSPNSLRICEYSSELYSSEILFDIFSFQVQNIIICALHIKQRLVENVYLSNPHHQPCEKNLPKTDKNLTYSNDTAMQNKCDPFYT